MLLQYSGGSPQGALCGRGDLDPGRPLAYGCYDSKATSWELALRLEADAVVGPSHGGASSSSSASGSGRPFAWSRSGELAGRVAHIGQLDVFDYRFERMTADASCWQVAALEH